ncbi:MAG: golvesin C-terminal-like domain-containing protein, partial [Planctomycetota bacterium]
ELWGLPETGTLGSLRGFVSEDYMLGGRLLDQACTVGDMLFFQGPVDPWSSEPFVSDGTPGGTLQYADLNSYAGSSPAAFTSAQGGVYFVANGVELYRTEPDGTYPTTKVAQLMDSAGGERDPAKAVVYGQAQDKLLVLVEGVQESVGMLKAASADLSTSPLVVTDLTARDWSYRPGQALTFGDKAVFTFEWGYDTDRSLFVTDDMERGTDVLYEGQEDELEHVNVVDDTIFFNALNPADGSLTTWVSDGVYAKPITLAGARSGLLTVEVLAEEGDRVVTARDGAAEASAQQEMIVYTSGDKQRLTVDVLDMVLPLLESGHRRVTFRLNTDRLTLLEVEQPEPGDETGLQITRPHGVVTDVHDADGGVLYRGQATVDMRWMTAGTYYLRVFNPHAGNLTPPVEFAVEITPPFQGQARDATDRDLIEGRDGDDVVVGNDHSDRLFGQSGHDAFFAEAVEVRDLEEDESMRAPDAEDRLASDPPTIVDPVLNEVIVDPDLIRALGTALNIPVTETLAGPVFAIDVRCSDMNALARLDLANLGIGNLAGLGYATNLVSLSLLGNPVSGVLDELSPRAAQAGEPDVGAQIGLRRLMYLNLNEADGTPLTTNDLMAVELIASMAALSASGNAIGSTSPLKDMADMQWLDLSDNRLEDLTALAGMSDLTHALLQDNYITDLGPLAAGAIIDNHDHGDGYSGEGWMHNIRPVAAAFRGDYHYGSPDMGTTATWTFTDLPPGDYEVLVTWHEHPEQASNAPYTVTGAEGGMRTLVNQKFTPDGPSYLARPWQSLGTYAAQADGSLQIVLVNTGVDDVVPDGTVVADGAMVLSAEAPVTGMRLLNLMGNGLDEEAHEIYAPMLQGRSTDARFELRLEPNHASPVWVQQIDPVAVVPPLGAPVVTGLSQHVADGLDRPMFIGAGGSAEILQLTGPLAAAPYQLVKVA